MKNIKVDIAPPYNVEKDKYASKVSTSVEFDNEVAALNFTRELNLLIIRFSEKANTKPNLVSINS